MKAYLIPLFLILHGSCLCQVITEIMYNPPESGIDSLEYLEIFNNTNADIELMGYSLIGVSHSFTASTLLSPAQFLILCKDSAAIQNNFGVSGTQWMSGALSNEGENIGLIDAAGDTIFLTTYDTRGEWPRVADGNGPSLELCDPNSDPNNPSNWNLSQGFTSIIISNRLLTGSPARLNRAVCQQRDYSDIAISEILFESPTWDNDLQYIEFSNFGDSPVNISQWSLNGDISLPSFPNQQIAPGEFYLIGKTPIALIQAGITMDGWNPNASISSAPLLILTNPDGNEVVKIDFDADVNFLQASSGQAVELCDLSMDQTLGLNWDISNSNFQLLNNSFFGTPGEGNSCTSIRTNTINLDKDHETNVKIYPNPCTDILNISSLHPIENIEIFNLQGQRQNIINNKSSINLNGLTSGSYILRISISGEKLYKHISKQ